MAIFQRKTRILHEGYNIRYVAYLSPQRDSECPILRTRIVLPVIYYTRTRFFFFLIEKLEDRPPTSGSQKSAIGSSKIYKSRIPTSQTTGRSTARVR